MCVIMVAECPKKILALRLKDAWQRNSDGAGILAWTKEGIIAFKGLMKFKALMQTLKSIPEGTSTAVHFRMGTHGAVNADNTHPFKIDEESYLMHNGVLTSLGKAGKDGFSDSGHLARILEHVEPLDRIALMEELGGKYLYADKDGMECVGDFTEKDGVQCSNTFWSGTTIVYSGYQGGKWDGKGGFHANSYDDDDAWSEYEWRQSNPSKLDKDSVEDRMIGTDSGKWANEMREKGWIEGPRGTWTPGTKSAELPLTLSEEVEAVRQAELGTTAQTREQAEAETIELLQKNAVDVDAIGWPGMDDYD